MLNEPTFFFPCPGCGSAVHIEMSQLENTDPATVSCCLCRTLVSVPRFGNRVLIADGDLFQVYRAVDRRSGQVVALKSIARSRLRDRLIQLLEERRLAAGAHSRPRPPDGAWSVALEEEIRFLETRIRDIASALRSFPATPYLVRLIDFCEDDREFNFVMELLRGETLAAHIRDSGPIDRRTAVEIVRCLLAALDAIHAAGFGHGNIRAKHIVFRSEDGQDLSIPVLCGFDLDPIPSAAGTPALDADEDPPFDPDPAKLLQEFEYWHPLLDSAAVTAQQGVARIQGVRHTWYAGAWLGYGFHEDGLRSAHVVADGIAGRTRSPGTGVPAGAVAPALAAA